jgi:hypothetical protein
MNTITKHRIEFQVVLGALGLTQLVNGIYATISPTGFYESFPLGRGWVEAIPAYNEHLMRDVGALFMATGFLLLAAAWFLERRMTLITLVAWLIWALPHTIYHLLNLEPYGAGDAVGNALALTATVLLPLWLLYRLATEPAEGPRRSRPRPSSSAPRPHPGREAS